MTNRSDIFGDSAFRRHGARGTAVEASYAGAVSYMRRTYTRDLAGVDIAVTGIPFDQAVTNRPGARFGPRAIRAASAQLAWGPQWPWMFDPFETLSVVDYGDCFFDWGRKQDLPGAVENHIGAIADAGASPLILGGDHYITYPVLKALAARHGPLALVHFDAHRDVEPEDDGERIDHGTMFTLALADGVIDPARSLQIGIRTTFTGERAHGIRIIYADEVQQRSPADIAEEIVARVGDHKAYLTFDIDCLDPAFAPGTGTPVAGGLSTHQALSIVRALGAIDFVGMDVVEVSPPYDSGEITALAAATIALDYICVKAARAGAVAVPLAP